MKRFIGPLVLIGSLVFASFAWWPDVSLWWHTIKGHGVQPIYIPEATATWVNDHQFDIEAPTFYWNDNCPTIWVNWWVQTRWNGRVAVRTHAIDGPFATRGSLPPSYKISITPQVGPPLRLRVTIPEELSASDIILVGVDDTVPDDKPCASGWTGVMEVFRLEVKQPNPVGR